MCNIIRREGGVKGRTVIPAWGKSTGVDNASGKGEEGKLTRKFYRPSSLTV